MNKPMRHALARTSGRSWLSRTLAEERKEKTRRKLVTATVAASAASLMSSEPLSAPAAEPELIPLHLVGPAPGFTQACGFPVTRDVHGTVRVLDAPRLHRPSTTT